MLSWARWGAFVLVALLLLIPVVVNALGYRLIEVQGASMEPTYRVGDVIVAGAPTGDDLILHDVVVAAEGDLLYTHRIVAVEDREGRRFAQLKGDANEFPDLAWISQERVFALPILSVPGAAGFVLSFAASAPGMALLIVTMFLLAGWTMLENAIETAILRSRRRRDPVPSGATSSD